VLLFCRGATVAANVTEANHVSAVPADKRILVKIRSAGT
jgi:hypothetical protein